MNFIRSLIKVFMILGWFIFGIPLIFGFVFYISGDSKMSDGFFEFSTWFFIISAILTFLHFKIANAQKNKFKAKVLEISPIKYFEHVNGTGIAITENGMLVMCSGSNIGSYKAEQIREWKWGIYEQGVSNNLRSVALEARRESAGTGIFVTVKDVNNPQWHIRIGKKKTILKWFEILNQYANG